MAIQVLHLWAIQCLAIPIQVVHQVVLHLLQGCLHLWQGVWEVTGVCQVS
jgi:hypothetical protein